MTKSFLRLFVLTSVFLTGLTPFAARAHPGLQCSAVFGFELNELTMDYSVTSQKAYFEKLTAAVPRIPAPLWKRYWKDPVTVDIQRNLLKKTAGESNRFAVDGGDFLTRTYLLEDHLFLDLVHIRAYQDGKGLGVGHRTKGVNSLLIKTMTAFLKTTVMVAEENPGITTLVIKGINLKNPMLIEFLQENGFSRNDAHSDTKEFEKTIQLRDNTTPQPLEFAD